MKFKGCCFFPLRICFFLLRRLFRLQSWVFSGAGFFPASDFFFPASDRFSCCCIIFPAASRMYSFCCKPVFCCCEVFFLAALDFSRCESVLFACVSPCCRLPKHFFYASKPLSNSKQFRKKGQDTQDDVIILCETTQVLYIWDV